MMVTGRRNQLLGLAGASRSQGAVFLDGGGIPGGLGGADAERLGPALSLLLAADESLLAAGVEGRDRVTADYSSVSESEDCSGLVSAQGAG